jgi:hypothetical protein
VFDNITLVRRLSLVLFILVYIAASVGITAHQTFAAASLFDAGTHEFGARAPRPSISKGAVPKFREAKKVITDFVSELHTAQSTVPPSDRADIVPLKFPIETAGQLHLPSRSPPDRA